MDTAIPTQVLLAYSDERAAALLDVGKGTVRTLRESGKLRAVKVGGALRIPHSELERYIRDQLGEDDTT